MTVYVDPHVEYHGHSFVSDKVPAFCAVQTAYDTAATNVSNAGRTPVQIEVIVRVAPITQE